eukprot:Pgem_evm1s17612
MLIYKFINLLINIQNFRKDNYGQNAANDRAKVECGGKVRYDKSFAERRYDWIEVNGQDENDMLTCSYNNSEVRDIVCKVD